MLPYVGAILLLVILLLLTIGVFLYLSGLFEPINVDLRAPPFLHDSTWFAYKIHEGPYSETGYLFTEAYSINPACIQCGIRYEKKESLSEDIVQSTTEEQVCETTPEPSVHCAVGSFVNEETMEEFKQYGFQLTCLPAVDDEAVVASFQHTSFLSIPIGSFRANYSMHNYIKEHDLKVTTFLELYGDGCIHYVGLYKDTEPFNLPPAKDHHQDEPTETNISDIETIEAVDVFPPRPPPTNSDDQQSNDEGSELDELDSSFEKITEVPSVVV